MQLVQNGLDMLIPGNSLIDASHDVEMLVNGDIELAMNLVGSIDISKMSTPMKATRAFKPRLRTGFAPRRQAHTMTGLTALNKRNIVNAHFAFAGNYVARAHQAVEYAFDQILVHTWRQDLAVRRETPIMPNEESVWTWFEAQTPEKQRRAENLLRGRSYIDLEPEKYNFILKPVNKPPVDESIQSEIQQPQTVIYHSIDVNAHYGPAFREVEEVFLSELKHNVIFNKGYTPADLEARLNEVDDFEDERAATYFENDMSAYDKSQHIETAEVERYVYYLLGLCNGLLDDWMEAHRMTKVKSTAMGIVLYLLYQRKSGDVTTSFGNSVVNIVALVFCYMITSFVYILFLGDDSLIKMKKHDVISENLRDGPKRMLDLFNLVTKFFLFSYGYFCGYIVTKLGTRNYLISDAVRRAVKLGRMDINDSAKFAEHWTSFVDVTRNYDNDLLVCQAVEALGERYPNGDTSGLHLMYWALHSMRKSFKEFRCCWEPTATLVHAR